MSHILLGDMEAKLPLAIGNIIYYDNMGYHNIRSKNMCNICEWFCILIFIKIEDIKWDPLYCIKRFSCIIILFGCDT